MTDYAAYNWIIKRLIGNDKVRSTKIDDEGILHIVRTNGVPLRIIKSPSLEDFDFKDIRPLADLRNVDYILYTSNEPYISGAALEYVEYKKKIMGGFADVYRVLKQEYNYPFITPDVRFIKRGLKQHSKVEEVVRLDDRRYEISRKDLETVVIIALNDYELGIESVRNSIEKYKIFDAILISNPYGNISNSALQLITSKNIKVFKWGELLKELNRRWKSKK